MNTDMIWQLVRYLLLWGGGVLVGKGYFESSQIEAAIGAIGTLFPLIWGAYVKWNTKAVPVQAVNPTTGKVVKGTPTVSSLTGQLDEEVKS